jgi:BMFP domain-containing protein YqiC
MTQAQLIDILEEASRQLGATSRSGFFDIARDALRALDNSPPTKARILLSAEAAVHAGGLAGVLSAAAEVVTDLGHLRITQDMIMPPVVVVVITAAEVCDRASLPAFVRYAIGADAAPERAVFVIHEVPTDAAATEGLRALSHWPGKVTLAGASPAELPHVIQGFLDERLQAARKTAIELSLQRIARYLQTIVADETKALELKKQLLGADLAAGRKPGLGGSSDLTNRIRGLIQKNILDTERAFKLKYDELNRVKQGEFQVRVANLLTNLTTEQVRTIERASKTETYETEVDPDFVETFVKDLRAPMQRQMQDDVKFVGEIRKMTIDQINAVLVAEGLKAIDQRSLYVAELQPRSVKESHFHINRKYSGEVTKDGLMQYFIALRDYTGMIMVLVGILAPLTLIATAPDAAPGSFLEAINQFSKEMKNFRAYVTFITALLVGGMLIYGFVDLRRRIPLRRLEEREREVQRSQDALEQEGRRMFNDASRDWVAQLATYIRDLAASINAEVEQSIRAKGQQVIEEMDVLRRKAGIEQANVDARMKGVMLLDRKLQTIMRN